MDKYDIKRYFRIKRYPAFAKLMTVGTIRRITRPFRTMKERRAVESKIPELIRFNQLAKVDRAQLTPYYKAYVSQISNEVMPISFELAVFLMVTCKILKPKSILDLGSGFSSFVFRLYQSEAVAKPIVCSVDDSEDWLGKTSKFLISHNLSNDNLINWYKFAAQKHDKYDLILHDLGSMRLRQDSLKDIFSCAHPGTIVLLDDVHFKGYRAFVRQTLSSLNLEYFALGCFTEDKYGRYSVLTIQSAP